MTVHCYEGKVGDQVPALFAAFDGIVAIVSLGAVVRLIAPHLKNKETDPAVVVIDEAGKFRHSHALRPSRRRQPAAGHLATALGAKAVLTTASDARETIAVDLLGRELRLAIRSQPRRNRPLQRRDGERRSRRPGPGNRQHRLVGQPRQRAQRPAAGQRDAIRQAGRRPLDRFAPVWIAAGYTVDQPLAGRRVEMSRNIAAFNRCFPPLSGPLARGLSPVNAAMSIKPTAIALAWAATAARRLGPSSQAIAEALAEANAMLADVRAVASIDLNADEIGLAEVARQQRLVHPLYPAVDLAAVAIPNRRRPCASTPARLRSPKRRRFSLPAPTRAFDYRKT